MKASASIIKLGEGYYFFKVENYLKEQELNEVWDEINFLSYRSKFKLGISTARDENSNLKSNKIGMWLDQVYTERRYSNYFKYYKKWINDETRNNLLKTSLFWRELNLCNHDTTLFSYYEDGKYYKEHQDTSRLTQLYYTYKEPKKFTGGQIVFVDFDYSQEISNNTLIVFPSWFKHAVKPVILNDKTPENQDKLMCNGRYVFTTFFA